MGSMIKKIKGLSYIPNVLNSEEQTDILHLIDNNTWLNDLKRRVQHYGYKYDYRRRKIDHQLKLGELPNWGLKLNKKLIAQKLTNVHFDQMIVNEYLPGQGISAHIDCEPCFENTILSLSLGSACTIHFKNKLNNRDRFVLLLEPGSVLIMENEARYDWLHEIKGVKTDLYNGVKFKRKRRVSLTFRKVILSN